MSASLLCTCDPDSAPGRLWVPALTTDWLLPAPNPSMSPNSGYRPTYLDPTSDEADTPAPYFSSYWFQTESPVVLTFPQCSLGLPGTQGSPLPLTPSSQVDQAGAAASGKPSPGIPLPSAGSTNHSSSTKPSPVSPALMDLSRHGQPEGWSPRTFWFCVVVLLILAT